MISVDAFKMNKADRTHHQPRTPAPKKNSRKASGIRKKTKKSGGSSPFYHLKKSAATTHPNALSIIVSVGRVVAVVALLPNSGRGKLRVKN